jgi:hypothetical protein
LALLALVITAIWLVESEVNSAVETAELRRVLTSPHLGDEVAPSPPDLPVKGAAGPDKPASNLAELLFEEVPANYSAEQLHSELHDGLDACEVQARVLSVRCPEGLWYAVVNYRGPGLLDQIDEPLCMLLLNGCAPVGWSRGTWSNVTT